MGSPLGPTLANVFMCHHEQIWIANCPSEFKPILYRRYVDDTFLLFRSPDHVPLFLEYLNTKHPAIKFTSDLEKDKTIPFLDILIKHNHDTFSTSVYRKPTFTGLFTPFSSFVPLRFKVNLVRILVYRIYKICSSYQAIHIELERLKSILLLNGYPLHFISDNIRSALHYLVAPKKQETATCAKKILYLSLPFTGKHGLDLRNKLLKLFRHHYPQLDLRIIFKPSLRIGSLF